MLPEEKAKHESARLFPVDKRLEISDFDLIKDMNSIINKDEISSKKER